MILIAQRDTAPMLGTQEGAAGRPLRAIVHDFNNLLAAIQGYSALLAEDLREGSTEKSFAEQIAIASESAKALVVELAELSRPQDIKRDLASATEGLGGDPSAAEGSKEMPGKVRILVVDDEAAIAELLARMLTRAGYEVDWFSNPLDALDAVAAEPSGWQAAVSDQSMPNMPGSEFAARLHSINPAIPVILCTGHDATEIRHLAAGVSQILVKPVSREQLGDAIQAALKGNGGARSRSAG